VEKDQRKVKKPEKPVDIPQKRIIMKELRKSQQILVSSKEETICP
jgi:hypothetical protein